MDTRSGANLRVQAFIGLLLIAGGTVVLLDRMEIIDFTYYLHSYRYWPLAFVALGLAYLTGYPEPKSVANGIWSVALGGWLFCVLQGLYGLTWRNGWPILVLAFGLKMVVEALLTQRMQSKQEGN